MIRILIADDFAPMRRVMRRLIKREVDIEVVGEALRLPEALLLIHQLQPDVIVMDDRLPPTNCAGATRHLRDSGMETPILVVATYPDAGLVQGSLKRGVNGFIFKEEFIEHFIRAIRAVYEGVLYLSPMAEELLRSDSE